jgi:hypothetical protein
MSISHHWTTLFFCRFWINQRFELIMTATGNDLDAFFSRMRDLCSKERMAEVEQSSLLLSACSPKLLEQKGLALLGLGVSNVQIGLGGKRLISPQHGCNIVTHFTSFLATAWSNWNDRRRITRRQISLRICLGGGAHTLYCDTYSRLP